jgi:hypothetical protein
MYPSDGSIAKRRCLPGALRPVPDGKRDVQLILYRWCVVAAVMRLTSEGLCCRLRVHHARLQAASTACDTRCGPPIQ